MTENEKLTLEEWHKKMAVDLFNFTWTLIEKKKRTQEDDDQMISAAHASRYHWSQRVVLGAGKPINLGRGDWQISRVYAVLQRAEPARYHAQRYLDICQEQGIADWDLAYAYEALARAAAVAGDEKGTAKYLKLAKEAGGKIEDEETRKPFFSDLETIPGYKP